MRFSAGLIAGAGFTTINYAANQFVNGVAFTVSSAKNPWNIQRYGNLNLWRFELRQGDQRAEDVGVGENRERAELAGPDLLFNTEYWFSYTFWIENGTPFTSDWLVTGQLHAHEDDGDLHTNPNWWFRHELSASQLRIQTAGNTSNPQVSDVTPITRYERDSVERDRRYDVVGRVIFSTTAGELDLYVNGVQRVKVTNVPIGYNDILGPYFKFGVYRKTDATTGVFFYANVEPPQTASLFSRVASPLAIPIYEGIIARPSDTYSEAEASALIARFTSVPSGFEMQHIHDWWHAAKASTWLAKLDWFWMLAAHDAQGAQRQWLADAKNLSPTASPTFTTNKGYTGNGSTQDLNPSINLSTDLVKGSQNSLSFGIQPLTSLANGGSNSFDMGTDRIYAARFSGNDESVFRIATSAAITNPGGLKYPHHLSFVRDGANSWKAYSDGALVVSGSDASATFTTTGFYLLRAGGVGRGVNQIASAYVGSALTDDEVADLNRTNNRYLYSRNAFG